jgi:hypothetical protein
MSEDKLIPCFIDFHDRNNEDRKWLNQLFKNSKNLKTKCSAEEYEDIQENKKTLKSIS